MSQHTTPLRSSPTLISQLCISMIHPHQRLVWSDSTTLALRGAQILVLPAVASSHRWPGIVAQHLDRHCGVLVLSVFTKQLNHDPEMKKVPSALATEGLPLACSIFVAVHLKLSCVTSSTPSPSKDVFIHVVVP